MFAVALDENSAVSDLTNERSSAIVGNQWDILDFGDIEEDLAAKITDDDIQKMLLCIDAVNKLKQLKLTNCVNIAGAGLEPLRGSSVIEVIDLSLVAYHQNPSITPEPSISCDDVLPILILDSVLESTQYFQFPAKWRNGSMVDSEFDAFLGRCNQTWRNRDTKICLACEDELPRVLFVRGVEKQQFGVQRNTCCVCLKHYCNDCTSADDDERFMIDFCDACDRNYCMECSTIEFCDYCEGVSCLTCRSVTVCGSECNNKICDD